MTCGQGSPVEITDQIKWIEELNQIRAEILDLGNGGCPIYNRIGVEDLNKECQTSMSSKWAEYNNKGCTKVDNRTMCNK